MARVDDGKLKILAQNITIVEADVKKDNKCNKKNCKIKKDNSKKCN